MMSDIYGESNSLYKPVKSSTGSVNRTKFNAIAASEDETTKFIRLIEERPALYNYKLPIEDRKRSIIVNQWDEVASIMKYSPSDCRRRWRNLRDTYHQYRIRKSNNSTGTFQNWKYTKNLDFLRDIHKSKPKRSKIKHQDNLLVSSLVKPEEHSYTLDQDELADESLATSSEIEHCYEVNEVQLYDEEDDVGNERYFDQVDMDQQHEMEMNAIIEDETRQEQPAIEDKHQTRPDPLDEVDLFFDFLKKKVRKLAPSDLTDLQIEILNLMSTKEKAALNK